jgi:hypothetical protein
MPPNKIPAPESRSASIAFPLAAGFFFFLVIIKFGDPVILDFNASPPQSLTEAVFGSWPSSMGRWLLVPLLAVGLLTMQWNRLRWRWALALPAIWLAWECVAGTQTVSPVLTRVVLEHFATCVILFYLGFFAMGQCPQSWPLWTGLALALCWVIRAGFEQHFGGLEATRKMIAAGQTIPDLSPQMLNNPDFQKRVAGMRIFSTFVYANALAGGLVLLSPLTFVFMWRLTPKVRFAIRVAFVIILGGSALACLYWSGSRAGWLVALTVGLIALAHSALSLKWKQRLIGIVLVLGVSGFAIKNAGYFRKERNSAEARFSYWRVCGLIIERHPLFGTGPGTFQIPYGQIKRASPDYRSDDEMPKLVHNDYLEQGTDSGIFGFVSYAVMIITFLYSLYRYSLKKPSFDWLIFTIWLGIFGLCLHSLVEFHLYIPALAWPMFFLFGWLLSL